MSRIERKNRDSVRHNRGQMSGLIGHRRGVFMDSVGGGTEVKKMESRMILGFWPRIPV